jgi:hypothetical protein
VWIGYYSANLNNTRTACTNTKPVNSIYSTSGGWVNNCMYTCNSWFEWVSCTAIPPAYSGTTRLQPNDLLASDLFWASLSISWDWNTVIIWAYWEDTWWSYAWTIYVFVKNWINWVQQAKLKSNDPQENGYFWDTLDISYDWNTFITWGRYVDGWYWAAYIFTRSWTTWTQQQKIQPTDRATNDMFWSKVALSWDWNTAIISSMRNKAWWSNAWAVYVFIKNWTIWTQQAKILSNDILASDDFWRSIDIDYNWNFFVAWARRYNDSDKWGAYVFTRSWTVWSQQQKLVPSNLEADDRLWEYVSISWDGNTVVVSASWDDTWWVNVWGVYVYKKNWTIWQQIIFLQTNDKYGGQRLRGNISLNNDWNTFVIWYGYDNTLGSSAGAAYIFKINWANWVQSLKIFANDWVASDYFWGGVWINWIWNSIFIWAHNKNSKWAAYFFTN